MPEEPARTPVETRFTTPAEDFNSDAAKLAAENARKRARIDTDFVLRGTEKLYFEQRQQLEREELVQAERLRAEVVEREREQERLLTASNRAAVGSLSRV